ncbi:MAG TPA: hypothetical protein VF033_12555 [Steroidobacteraceae bacterium]
MESVAVVGLPGSSAAKVAEKLGGLLRPGEFQIHHGSSVAEIADADGAVILADDAPVGAAAEVAARTELLARVAAARTSGHTIAILRDRKGADRWLARVKEEGLPAAPGPLRRVFVASGHSEVSVGRVKRLAEALGLPLIEPDAPGDDHSGEGWGPRYAHIAEGEHWVVHTPSWHAVEMLTPFADIVIHSETTSHEASGEFPAPNPEARKWRVAFSPWLKRYPGVEARLLARELAGHAHEAPLFRIRTSEEGEAVLQGFLRGAAQRA